MENDEFPLHWGIGSFNGAEIHIIELLLEKHADHINVVDSEGRTPLHLAAHNPKCHPEVVELLLAHGADVKAKSSKEGNTALHYVAMCNSPRSRSVIDILLKHGGDVDAVNSEGDTPLHSAARNKSDNAPEWDFLQLVSDVNAKNLNGDTPLHFYLQNKTVTRCSYVRTSRFVRKCGNLNLANSQDETPLHFAAQNPNCYPEIIKLLVEHGADVRAATTRDGNTALHYVAMSNDISSHSAVKLLLKRGSSVNVGNLEGDTPLHMAARNDGVNAPLAELLMEHASDVNVKNRIRDTPLHLHLRNKTMMNNFARTLEFVRKCSDINLPNCYGETPLHLVVKNESFHSQFTHSYCQISLIRLLIDHGADNSKEDATGVSVYEAYCEAVQEFNGQKDPMLEIILQPDELQKKISSSLHVACLFHKIDSIRDLLRYGTTGVNSTEHFGYSPLLYALIAHGHDDERLADKCSTIRLLLDHCADMTHQFTRSNLSLSNLVFNGVSNMDEKDYRAMRSVFLKHTAKLLTLRDNPADVSNNPDVIRQFNIYYFPTPEEIGAENIQEFDAWRSQCAEELKWMSHVTISEGFKVTFLDLLLSSAEKAAIYVRNKELVQAFDAKKALFPMYQGILDAKLSRKLERRKLVESAAVAFSDFLGFADPSDDFFERMFSYCSNEDLERLIKGTSDEIDERT
ncbi:putative ankyrin repeat protein RF_0381 [Nasonia vitripennis]|uniref:Uncharacterized protein n=1 Tax=Nasonia vitripennis TaxID=7425 RepID=A0A7M7M1K3_NASVI|nr:putative ankyrin repeat protein RF_0381 [Nasonia vitripennis]